MSLVFELTGQRCRDVIGRLSVSSDVIGCKDSKKLLVCVRLFISVVRSIMMCQRDVSAHDLLCKEKLIYQECLKCFVENEEAEKILVKTIFRRSKAFMELGNQLRALNDISFCLRSQVNTTGNANNVLFNYWEVGMICTCSNNNYCLLERFSIEC